jgi:hypothetical protein
MTFGILPYLDWFKSLMEIFVSWQVAFFVAILVFRRPISNLVDRVAKMKFGKAGIKIVTSQIAQERVESAVAQIDTVQEAGQRILRPEATPEEIMALSYVSQWGAREVAEARRVFKEPNVSLASADSGTRNAIIDVLNFLEELASAIRMKKVDESIISNALSEKIKRYWGKRGLNWTRELREEMSNPKLYENAEWLVERWTKK